MNKKVKTATQKRAEKIAAIEQWLFSIINSYEVEGTREQLEGIGQWFSAGCFLIAQGNQDLGLHVSKRAMNRVIDLVPGCIKQAQLCISFLETNCERFARAAGSRKEINKAFSALDYQDEVLD